MSIEAEQKIIGAILLHPEVLDDVLKIVTPDMFKSELRGKMFFAETTDIQMPSNALETGDVFDLQGRRVASKMQLKNLQNQLPKGIYIVKNGQKTVKVTIK